MPRKRGETKPVYGIITALTYQKRDSYRASVFVGGEFAFGVNVPTVERFRLRKGDEIDSVLYEKIVAFDNGIAARRRAQKFLDIRRRSERDVRKKLAGEDFDEALIDEVIEELKRTRLIDDLAYAKAFVHDRLLTKALSRGKLAIELRSKGVSKTQIDEALQDIAGDDDEIARSLIAARKKLPTIERKTSDGRQRSQKLYAFLAGRGFTTPVIRKTLEQLNQPVEDDAF